MSAPTRRRSRDVFDQVVRCVGYTRYCRRDGAGFLIAQVLVVPGHRAQMSVKAADEALDFDFRHHSIRPDLSDQYRRRPGFYLHEILARLTDKRAILLNGNNVGYWGNQFVIDEGRLVYKTKGPLFDDGRLQTHASGDYAFFLDASGFRVADIKLLAEKNVAASDVNITPVGQYLPPYGISGFPLLRSGRAVWREHGELAWDPGLLFDLGTLREDGYSDIRALVRQLLEEKAELARHPMTVIGVDTNHNVVLLVATRTRRSRGMTVARAADLLRERFGVRDAIVLGAAGDTQLATTEEGFLTTPYVAPYADFAAEPVPEAMLSRELQGCEVRARPVPSYVLLEIKPT